MEESAARGVARLCGIVAALRGPGGCPWDREQTHVSLRAALIEETYEVIDAIDAGDFENLCEELGDLLLHVTMHARMAQESGRFNLADVADGICEKLIRRHPHVFSVGKAQDSAAVLKQWEEIKRGEKAPSASAMDGVPRSLPAATRAQKAQKKASRVGFDWTVLADVLRKVSEEAGELTHAVDSGDRERAEAEAGDLLFAAVNAARFAGVDAELALREATNRFVGRVQACENLARLAGRELRECDAAQLDEYWREAKAAESRA